MKNILLLFIALGFISCKKFLNETSTTEIIPKKTADFGDLLANEGYTTYGGSTAYNMAGYIMSDDVQYYNAENKPVSAIDYCNSPAFLWQPDFIESCALLGSPDVTTFNLWITYYRHILGTNIAIQYLDGSIGTREEKDWYKGQAYALRAYYYFKLVNFYAKPYNDSTTTPDRSLGVPLKLDANVVEKPMVRNTVKEVYTQITADLDSAISLLDKERRTHVAGILDLTSTYFLASRIYLYMEEWEKAERYAGLVLEKRADLVDLNTYTGEVIGENNPETIYAYGSIFQENLIGGGATAIGASWDLFGKFESTDLRSMMYVYEVPDFLKPYIFVDLLDNKLTSSYPSNDIRLSWRTAEMYLNRAEACVQLYRLRGDAAKAQQALDDLNTLRSSRYISGTYTPWTMSDGDELLQKCRDERRRELCFEEDHRWMDLRRYGMPEIYHTYAPAKGVFVKYKLAKHDPQYVLPIPVNVLRANPGLLQNEQISTERKAE